MSMLNADIIIDARPITDKLQTIYKTYCQYKKFDSVMPIFNSEFLEFSNNIIAYYHEDDIVAFSLLRCYDSENVEAIQFAWDYKEPSLRLGIESLKHECAFYKKLGYKYLYLGQTDDYKNEIDGYEVLGPL
jgi:hypothetical protein